MSGAGINLPKIDVIIVSYYTGDILFKCIGNVLAIENLGELILINNGNPPDVEEALAKISSVKLVTGHGNIGFARGCNMGANISSASSFLFLNPDCEVTDPELLQKLFLPLMDKNSEYKVSTCLILNKDGSIQKTCRRNLLTPLVAISESFNLYKIFSYFKPLNKPISEIENLPAISSVEALSGAVVFTTKKYYEEIKGFDEIYFLHVEDMDFCMKVKKNGGKIAFVKDAIVKHYLSTSKTTNKFLEFHKARGFIIYMEKYFTIFHNPLFSRILKFLIWGRYFIKTKLF